MSQIYSSICLLIVCPNFTGDMWLLYYCIQFCWTLAQSSINQLEFFNVPKIAITIMKSMAH